MALLISVLLAPLWMSAFAGEAQAAVRDGAAIDAPGPGGAHPRSSEPAECVDDDSEAVADDDDTSSSEPSLTGLSSCLTRSPGSPLRYAVRAGAAPPRVHLEAETPPPRP